MRAVYILKPKYLVCSLHIFLVIFNFGINYDNCAGLLDILAFLVEQANWLRVLFSQIPFYNNDICKPNKFVSNYYVKLDLIIV